MNDIPSGDPPIDEVREIRHQISTQFDHDPVRLVEYYTKLQEQYKDRLLKEDSKAEKPGQEAA